MLLQSFDKSDNREKSGQRHRERNRTHDCCSLPEKDTADTEHAEIVRTSLNLRKFSRVCVNDSNHAQKTRTLVRMWPKSIAPG
jgi:hypothetical protein